MLLLGKKPLQTDAMIFSVIGLVFSLVIPLVTYVFGTAGIVVSIKNKEKSNTVPSLVISIIALAAALVNSILSVMAFSPA